MSGRPGVNDSRLAALWQALQSAGGLAVCRLLQSASGAAAVVATVHAAAALDACWERLHTGDWRAVPVAWRDAYTLAALLRCQHAKARAERIELLDLAALVGGNLFRPDLDAALADELDAEGDQAGAKRARLDQGPALGEGEPLTGYGAIELPPGAGVGGIPRADIPSLEAFATQHMAAPGQPVVVTGLLTDWPAMQLWRRPEYLLSLAGERTVPVELGEHYLSAGWQQQLMTVRRFLELHVLPARPRGGTPVGYLAQHPLFEQVPSLAGDIRTPDYCTLGSCGAVRSCNAWLGPGGTVTPLHMDPEHNLLCQVVGVKHVRLYSPACTPLLYPHTGGHVTNSSRVDVRRVDRLQFPLFEGAPYLDVDLEAGEVRARASWACLHLLSARGLTTPHPAHAGAVHPARVVALRARKDNLLLRQLLLGVKHASSGNRQLCVQPTMPLGLRSNDTCPHPPSPSALYARSAASRAARLPGRRPVPGEDTPGRAERSQPVGKPGGERAPPRPGVRRRQGGAAGTQGQLRRGDVEALNRAAGANDAAPGVPHHFFPPLTVLCLTRLHAPQRKPAWTSSDVGRFTELLRLEHDAQASEAAALQQLRSSEAGVDSKLVAYAEALRERYQQEQEYAATSRTMATWGTWVLLGVNTLLFSANVLIFEPRKQRRAEERMRGVIAESGEDIVRRLAPPMDDAAEDDSHIRRPPPPPPPLISPEVAVAAVVQAALSDAEQRRAAVDHRLEQRMEALAKAVEKAISGAAVAAATGARSQDGSVRGRLRRAWTAVPLLNEVLRRQDEWPLAVLGVAATGGFFAGLLASALSGR